LYTIQNDGVAAKVEAAETGFANARKNLSPESSVLSDLRLTMLSAEAKYQNDSLYYIRLRNLMEQNIGTQNNLDIAHTNFVVSDNQRRSAEARYHSTLDQLRLALKDAGSQLINARTELEHYTIRSESGGTVFQTFKENGETVRAGEMLALLGQTSGRIIRLAVDQQDIDKIATGQRVLVRTDVTGEAIYRATVTRLYPVMDQNDQTFRVDAVFADSVRQPFIHSSVEANIVIRQKARALVIPRAALVADDSVRVLLGRGVTTVAVKRGIRTLEEVEVLGGLDSLSRVLLPAKN
ncbi:MAG TPA: HlyD family efflux transporter periplasmic adaptor subunit, partial [Puia sp.]|nr:HlyD family efflux transporter periplasmic adaptor subunit [Puia sp.]